MVTREQLIRKMNNKELCDYYFANEPSCSTCRDTSGCKEIMMMELEQGRANDPAPSGVLPAKCQMAKGGSMK